MDGGFSGVSGRDGRHGWAEMGEANQRIKIRRSSCDSSSEPVFHYMLIKGQRCLSRPQPLLC